MGPYERQAQHPSDLLLFAVYLRAPQYRAVSLLAVGAWRNWPERASVFWLQPRPSHLWTLGPGWALWGPFSSCLNLLWVLGSSTSPGPSREPEESTALSPWSWWVFIHFRKTYYTKIHTLNFFPPASLSPV